MITIKELKCHERALEVCVQANDYFQLVSGRSVTRADVDEIFVTVPPTKTLTDKLILGVYEDSTLIGMIDVIKDYPSESIGWIGLFLLVCDKRNHGLGKSVHQTLIEQLKACGANFIRLGVIERNTKALKFWERIGYKTQQVKTMDTDSMMIMELELS